MHAVVFSLKRVYWGTIEFGKEQLAVYGLTPARFDLLVCVAAAGKRIWQGDLCRRLGVSRMTVSRMVRSLEKLGFLARTRVGRRMEVRITAEGATRLAAARRDVVDPGVARQEVHRLFVLHRRDADIASMQVRRVGALLRMVRRRQRDGAVLDYGVPPD